MYLIYLFKEKKTDKIIYVGSSARPASRMKEHKLALEEAKPSNQQIYSYMRDNGLKFYKDVEIIWTDCADTREEMYELEAKYYYKHIDTILNDRPADITKGKYNPRRRKVKCLNDGQIFSTVTECARYYNKGRTTISNVLIGDKPHTLINGEKYYFEYVDKTCND